MDDETDLLDYNRLIEIFEIEHEIDIVNLIRKGLPAYAPGNLEKKVELQGIYPCFRKETMVQVPLQSTPLERFHRFRDGEQAPYRVEKQVNLIPIRIADLIFKLSEVEVFERLHGLKRRDQTRGKAEPGEAASKSGSTSRPRNRRHEVLRACKEKYREIAKKEWQRHPAYTKTATAEKIMHEHFRDGYDYGEKENLILKIATVENYIKDLNPNRNPGRRREK